MLIKKPSKLTENDVTPKELFDAKSRIISASRRGFLARGGAALLAAGIAPNVLWAGNKIANIKQSKLSTTAKLTPYEDVTTYNNFYEFGLSKSAPARQAKNFKTKPWTVTIDGEVSNGGEFLLEDLLKKQTLEERIYRFRCVEAWSMVIPWIGFSLADLLKQAQPTSKAKYVSFTTLYDPEQMPGQRSRALKWPYTEGLTLAEAMNPLTLMATGLYGEELPNQNGAPLRLVVPWKYGFKSIKSIVKITLTEKMPKTSWNESAKHEYGFFANVNPNVSHPRWSQRRERVIGAPLFTAKRPTEMFNGYEEQVAHLYRGYDLSVYF